MQPLWREYCFLFLITALQIIELQATAIRQEEPQTDSKVLNKRGHKNAGAPNDYGPPIKITSSILQLTKATEGSTNIADIQHHETSIDSAWHPITNIGVSQHSIWLDAGTSAHADPTALEVGVSDGGNNYIPWQPQPLPQPLPQPHDVASGAFSHGEAVLGGLSSGLHTRITSSGSGQTVSDNLDFEQVAERKQNPHYSTSYDR